MKRTRMGTFGFVVALCLTDLFGCASDSGPQAHTSGPSDASACPEAPQGHPDRLTGEDCQDSHACLPGDRCTNPCGHECTCVVGDPREIGPDYPVTPPGYLLCTVPVTGTPCDPTRVGYCRFQERWGTDRIWVSWTSANSNLNRCDCEASPDPADVGTPMEHRWKCAHYQISDRDSVCPRHAESIDPRCTASGLTCEIPAEDCGACPARLPPTDQQLPQHLRFPRCVVSCERDASGERRWICQQTASDAGAGG